MNYVSDLDSLICGFDPVFLLTKHDTWHSLIDIKLQNKCEKLKYFYATCIAWPECKFMQVCCYLCTYNVYIQALKFILKNILNYFREINLQFYRKKIYII
jgi:hypothetical protein